MADITGYLDIIRNATSGESVRDAIINCMNDINKDAAVQITTKAISGKLSNINKTYKAPTGYAWSQVSLSVTDDDGEEKIVNDIISDELTINDDTPNGDYEPETNHVYSKVHVDVTRDRTDIVDNVNISLDDLDEMNGYSAISHGYNAMKRVTFIGANIAAATGGTVGPGGVVYYTCRFFDNVNKTGTPKTVQVQRGGYADYPGGTLPVSPDPSQSFAGWDPPLGNVTKNVDYIPVFASTQTEVGEINDSWLQILNSSRAYPIGSYKLMTFPAVKNIPYFKFLSGATNDEGDNYFMEWPKSHTYAFSITFIKVAQGEDGTSSTFISREPVNIPIFQDSNDSRITRISWGKVLAGIGSASGTDSWENNSYLRQFFSRTFMGYIMPKAYRSLIKPVSKQTKSFIDPNVVITQSNFDANLITYKTIKDTIWIPSMAEMKSIIPDDVKVKTDRHNDYEIYATDNKFTKAESRGIDYSASGVWTPYNPDEYDSYSKTFIVTRSSGYMKSVGYYGDRMMSSNQLITKTKNSDGTATTIISPSSDTDSQLRGTQPYVALDGSDALYIGFCC